MNKNAANGSKSGRAASTRGVLPVQNDWFRLCGKVEMKGEAAGLKRLSSKKQGYKACFASVNRVYGQYSQNTPLAPKLVSTAEGVQAELYTAA